MNTIEQDMIRDLFGELSQKERAELERRLAVSPSLQQERERLSAAIVRYRELGEDEPPEVDFRAFTGEGETPGKSQEKKLWPLQMAAGFLIAIAAFLAGRATQAPGDGLPSIAGATGDQTLVEETVRLRREVALLAMHQAQVSERIAAIEAMAASLRSDPWLRKPLLEALRDDPSVNVRLAVVDALFVAPEAAPALQDLARILSREPTPALRLALVDWIAASRPPGWRELLRTVGEEDENIVVRSRVRSFTGERS